MSTSFARARRRLGRLYADESGAAALFAVVSLMFLVIVVAYVHNVGMTVNRRIRLQNAADAAAYSGAMVEANALSAIAWLNSCQTYIYARMQESILEMMPLATGAGAIQWGRYVFGAFRGAPVGFLGEAPHEEPAWLREMANKEYKNLAEMGSIPGADGSGSVNVNTGGVSSGDAEALTTQMEELEAKYQAALAVEKVAKEKREKIDGDLRAARNDFQNTNDPAEQERIRVRIEQLVLDWEVARANEIAATNEVRRLEGEGNDLNDRAQAILGGINIDKGKAGEMKGIAQRSKNINDDRTKENIQPYIQSYWEKPYDPPPVWENLMVIPIVGEALADLVGAEGHKITNGQMATLASDFPDDEFVRDGAPPWEEFKFSMAGYFPMAVALWNARLSVIFNESVDSTDDLVNLVKEKALPLVKEWVGSRTYDEKGNPTEFGSRPGETWIRQLSTVAGSIAKAMPEMVRNEMLYSLSVNAPPGTLAAIYPPHNEQNPEKSWGNVSFARYDSDDGKAFFRYDHFAMPPAPWVRPPYWTNSYPLAAELVSRGLSGDNVKGFLGYEDDLRKSNPALWETNGAVYGNRFLHEARRQNARMRSIQPNDLLERFGIPVGSVGDVELLAYAEKETQREAGSHGYPPHLRMKLANTFYYDEYAGRPGRDDNGRGDGFALRKTNMGWNRNDRYWNREPSEDTVDRRTTMFSNIAIGRFRLPVPLPLFTWLFPSSIIPNHENPNFNVHPRDDMGYAPGSSFPFLGHLPFLRSIANVNDEQDAADGHWHAEHYHANSFNDNHSYPNTFCLGLNCMIMGAIRYMIGDRSQWEGNVHVPYKHWDGWTGNDSEDSQEAADYHIHSAINNWHAGQKFLYNLSGAGATIERKRPERLPVSFYNLCIGCSTFGISALRVCTCGGCRDIGLHGSRGGADWFPKDSMLLHNTPVIWIGDYNPHWLSAIGSWLTWGDIEGDPFLFFGCGDPYFYDWLYMGIDALTASLPSDENSFGGKVNKWLEGAVPAPLHEIYPFEADDAAKALGGVSGIDVSKLTEALEGSDIQSEGAMQLATVIFDTLFNRTGHHRFLQDPLTMSICPLCGERHLGGDWGPHKNAGSLYQLLDTGDRRVDAGIAYSQLLKGHDLAYKPHGVPDGGTQGALAYSALDFDFDIDDGLVGYSPNQRGSARDWRQNFAADRFVREWCAPEANPEFAPTVMLTENFFRYGVSVALVDKYRPVFGMFGAERTITAVATARVGFIERLPDSVFPDSPGDGKGAGDSPQIITGADEIGADGRIWDLDRIWSEFIDFPNQKPEVESNLYYADYGVKLVSTRYAILANAGSGDNARRATDNRYTSMEDAEIAFWKELGAVTCFLPDGTATGTTLADAMLPGEDWDKFASEYVQTRYAMEGEVQ